MNVQFKDWGNEVSNWLTVFETICPVKRNLWLWPQQQMIEIVFPAVSLRTECYKVGSGKILTQLWQWITKDCTRDLIRWPFSVDALHTLQMTETFPSFPLYVYFSFMYSISYNAPVVLSHNSCFFGNDLNLSQNWGVRDSKSYQTEFCSMSTIIKKLILNNWSRHVIHQDKTLFRSGTRNEYALTKRWQWHDTRPPHFKHTCKSHYFFPLRRRKHLIK